MAKPINLYQGAAPAAMSQMGAGLAQAGANIGQSLQQGYQSLGQGIAGGINAAASAYKQYKETQSQVKASEKSYEVLKDYLPPEVQSKFDTQIESMNQDPNVSLRDKAAFWDQAKSFMGSSIGQTFQMEKQQAGDAAAKERTLLGIQARAEELGGPALPSEGGTAMPGAPFYDQGLAPQQPVNPFGSLLKKRHFGGN